MIYMGPFGSPTDIDDCKGRGPDVYTGPFGSPTGTDDCKGRCSRFYMGTLAVLSALMIARVGGWSLDGYLGNPIGTGISSDVTDK